MKQQTDHSLAQALWRIFSRSQPAVPWRDGSNLPWDDPQFSERMLREHLDQGHGAASRRRAEILRQVDWLWTALDLQPGARLLDITCGPGLYALEFARRGVHVTGIDFGPASLRHARSAVAEAGVADRCRFIQADVREALPGQAGQGYDAALFLYGQFAVFTRQEGMQLLQAAAAALRPGGRLAMELLDSERVDRRNNNWWFSDDTGLWGDAPFLCLGERYWDEAQRASIDRFYVIHLESGLMDEISVCDNVYEAGELQAALRAAGFSRATALAGWNGLELYDAEEWVVYVAER